MKNTIIEVTCPRDGYKWTVDVEDLKRNQTIYKSTGPGVVSYRVQCPQDGTWVIVDVRETTDE